MKRSYQIAQYLGLSPFPVIVTTRIITFLVGNPYKPSFATGILGGGTTQPIPLSYLGMTFLGTIGKPHGSRVGFDYRIARSCRRDRLHRLCEVVDRFIEAPICGVDLEGGRNAERERNSASSPGRVTFPRHRSSYSQLMSKGCPNHRNETHSIYHGNLRVPPLCQLRPN